MATSSKVPESHIYSATSHDSLSDAEQGIYYSPEAIPVTPLPFVFLGQQRQLSNESGFGTPIHQGITPLSSVPELSLSFPTNKTRPANASKLATVVAAPPPSSTDSTEKKAAVIAVQKKRKVSRWTLFQLWFNTYRKFFVFVTTLNGVGIVLAALGRWKYAENHLGALVLGNLLMAIMFRNELWMRFLYTVFIYGLKGVCVVILSPLR
jgi:hypothetical protein